MQKTNLQHTVRLCKLCPISCGRQLCEPTIENSWMVVGEQANGESAAKGVPFMDRGGLQVRKIFHLVSVQPRYTYLVKCESSAFRVAHWENCKGYLFQELKQCKPKVVVLLGDNVAKRLKWGDHPAHQTYPFPWDNSILGVKLPYKGKGGFSKPDFEKSVETLRGLRGDYGLYNSCI